MAWFVSGAVAAFDSPFVIQDGIGSVGVLRAVWWWRVSNLLPGSLIVVHSVGFGVLVVVGVGVDVSVWDGVGLGMGSSVWVGRAVSGVPVVWLIVLAQRLYVGVVVGVV